MKTKQYTNGEVAFGYNIHSGKWEFQVPSLNMTFLTTCPKRAETANKVAKILIGAAKRGSVDNLARFHIRALGCN